MIEQTVQGLENQIAGTLKPVQPRGEFFTGLEKQITEWKQLIVETNKGRWKLLLVSLLSLLSLAILLALIGKSLFKLLRVRQSNP